MNKITQIKNQIETVRVHRSQSQEPEKFDMTLQRMEDQLLKLKEEAKARKIARRLRKSTQASTWPLTGISVIPIQTSTMGVLETKPNWNTQDSTIEVQLFANQVMKAFEIRGKVLFCSRRVSFARKANMSVNFGSKSMDRAYKEGFAEYQQLKKMIAPYKPTGKTGLRLLVLHELAHLMVFMNYSKRVQPHGYEFQVEYSKLLKAFHSALEGK